MSPSNDLAQDITDTQVHPWRRFFARTADYFLFQAIAFTLYLNSKCSPQDNQCVLDLMSMGANAGILDSSLNQQLWFLQLMLALAFILTEAILISNFGTTPGKWCFGLSVKSDDNAHPEFNQSIGRSLRVWVVGTAMSIPILQFVAMAFAYHRLDTHGITWWDQKCATQVHAAPLPIIRVVILVLGSYWLLLKSYMYLIELYDVAPIPIPA